MDVKYTAEEIAADPVLAARLLLQLGELVQELAVEVRTRLDKLDGLTRRSPDVDARYDLSALLHLIPGYIPPADGC